MLKTFTQCDMCGQQIEHTHVKGPDGWNQLVMNGLPSIPVVALTRDLCPECSVKFIKMWMGLEDFTPRLWKEECLAKATRQSKS